MSCPACGRPLLELSDLVKAAQKPAESPAPAKAQYRVLPGGELLRIDQGALIKTLVAALGYARTFIEALDPIRGSGHTPKTVTYALAKIEAAIDQARGEG